MKFAFFGTPRIAAVILEELLKEGLVPVALICNPDKPVGRKQIITPPITKMMAVSWNVEIEVLQPEKLDEIFIEKLKSLNCDFFVVAAYGKLIPKEVLDIPRFGTIGIHPSLLPKYRGASPIQSAILAGDEITGVSLYMVDEEMDKGPIIASREFKTANENYCELEHKLGLLGAKLFTDTILDFIEKKIIPVPQDENLATYTKKFTTGDGFVDLEKEEPKEIVRKVRALNPEPGTWTIARSDDKKPFDTAQGKRMKVLDADISLDGKLILKEFQMEGGKPQKMVC